MAPFDWLSSRNQTGTAAHFYFYSFGTLNLFDLYSRVFVKVAPCKLQVLIIRIQLVSKNSMNTFVKVI